MNVNKPTFHMKEKFPGKGSHRVTHKFVTFTVHHYWCALDVGVQAALALSGRSECVHDEASVSQCLKSSLIHSARYLRGISKKNHEAGLSTLSAQHSAVCNFPVSF